ncbi:biotin transporter BioY [Carboxydochorda subterranea]|uniref:Biotin transporter n=1 Tax=Carboxydichorda subterranea TaxID=3109565 RepID=A0ABZ1BV31_9FIRM|nr:biotin transporter BioY [Limnochorda sp. L945t]WRP16381.1 biotin transporter BioY [Limnochorda sp. L945t]
MMSSVASPSTLSQWTRAAMAASLVAVLAQVAIPLPFTPVPVTLQVLGVLLTAIVLPPRAAGWAMALYLALGAAGVPVFAGSSGGPGVLLGPTGGYLWGFPVAAVAASALYRMPFCRARVRAPATAAAVAAGAAVAIIYLAGASQLALVLGLNARRAVAMGVVPFIGWDLAKAAAAALVGPAVERALTRAPARAPDPRAPARPA